MTNSVKASRMVEATKVRWMTTCRGCRVAERRGQVALGSARGVGGLGLAIAADDQEALEQVMLEMPTSEPESLTLIAPGSMCDSQSGPVVVLVEVGAC